MRRRSIVPFFVGSKRVANLADLKNVLSENPAALLEPLRDGRLKRFLAGLGERYVNCLNYDSPEESLKALGREIGIELEGALNLEESGAVVSSGDEILRLLSSDEEGIVLPSGTIFVEKLVIDRPVKIIGQGRNTTVLKCNLLEITSESVIFENILCEIGVFLPKCFPEFVNSYISFKTSVSDDLSFARGIEVLKDGNSIKFAPKILEIEILESIDLSNREVFYENVRFIIKEKGNLNFKNSTCSILSCYFEGKADILAENSCFSIENSSFKEVSLKLLEGSKIRVFNSSFLNSEKSLILLGTDVESEVGSCEFKENKTGIWVDSGAKLKVVASKFEKHKNPNGEGVGIVCFYNSVTEVNGCQFVENESGIRIKSNAKLKVKNSKFEKHKNPNGMGQGIICGDDSAAEVDSCQFIENEGGIWVGNDAKLKARNSKFEKHKNPDGVGSGIVCGGDSAAEVDGCQFIENENGIRIENNAKLKAKNSKFEKHKNPNGVGSGIVCFDNSAAEVDSCQFIENQLGIWVQGNARLRVKNSKFEKHKNPNGVGSGIVCFDDSAAEVDSCQFVENQLGIWVQGNAKLTVYDSLIDALYVDSMFVKIINSRVGLIEYKGEGKKPTVQNSTVDNWQDVSGCFITTATCLSLGKGDNCYELNTFRKFRDEWLLKQPGGEKLVEEYYTIAPLIVESINSLPEKHKIFTTIWRKYLKECLKLIENGKYEEAKALYLTMVTDLKGRFLN